MKHLRRDPFARLTWVRRVVPSIWHTIAKCAWCGATRKKMYQYGQLPDTGAAVFLKGEFCGLDCARSYHPDLDRAFRH